MTDPIRKEFTKLVSDDKWLDVETTLKNVAMYLEDEQASDLIGLALWIGETKGRITSLIGVME